MAVTFFLEYNSDLQITPSGSLQTALEWDTVRQRIIRRVVTSAARQLPDGTFTSPDYVWHPDYGVGLGKLVGQNFNKNFLTQVEGMITRGILEDSAVESSSPPSIRFIQPNPNTLWILATVTIVGCGCGIIQFAIQK